MSARAPGSGHRGCLSTVHATYPIDTHFDENFADEIAQLETYNKHIYRPNTYLHKWWARRCGSTFRYLLKQLVEDERMQTAYLGRKGGQGSAQPQT